MTSHATAEQLSSYLDDRLDERGRDSVERHLDECGDCRSRLDGMRRVVEHLERLEHTAPPAGLDRAVRRRIELDGDRRGLLARLERGLRGVPGQPPLLAYLGPLVALAIILLIFSQALQWQRGDDAEGRGTVAEDRATVVHVGSRAFEWRQDRWVERGLEAVEPARELELEAIEDWRTRHAELVAFEPLGGIVLLELGGEAVTVRYPPRP